MFRNSTCFFVMSSSMSVWVYVMSISLEWSWMERSLTKRPLSTRLERPLMMGQPRNRIFFQGSMYTMEPRIFGENHEKQFPKAGEFRVPVGCHRRWILRSRETFAGGAEERKLFCMSLQFVWIFLTNVASDNLISLSLRILEQGRFALKVQKNHITFDRRICTFSYLEDKDVVCPLHDLLGRELDQRTKQRERLVQQFP